MDDDGLMFIATCFENFKIDVIIGVTFRNLALIFQRTTENRVVGIFRKLQLKHFLENR